MEMYIYLTLIIIGIGMFVWYLVALPNEKRIALIRVWLLQAVTLVEKEVGGGGTGAIKLSKVYDMFVKQFPFLSKVVSLDLFKTLVNDALKELEELIEKNVNVENYIKYKK